MPRNIHGTRYPVGTWRVCQQCREFYTEAQPCPCRQQTITRSDVLRHKKYWNGLKTILSGFRRWWYGDR